MLQNEDIRLFVEVIEEETDKQNESRRFASVHVSRSTIRNIEIKPTPQPLLSPLSLSLSTSKISSKKRIKVLNSKGKRVKMRSTKSSFSNYAVKKLAKSFKADSLVRLNKKFSNDSSFKLQKI